MTSPGGGSFGEGCPRCGRGRCVEELGAASGTLWLHCDFCGHLWRRLDPESDAFTLILQSRARSGPSTAEPDDRSGRVPRAPRFPIRVAMKYRPRSETEWRPAMTENVSRSGVLFRADAQVDLQTAIELMIVLPGAVVGEPPSRLRCDGHVVRSTTCAATVPQPCVAAAVDDYRLAS